MAEKKQSTKFSTDKVIKEYAQKAKDSMHNAMADFSSSQPLIDENKVKFLSNPKIMAALGATASLAGASLAGLIKIKGKSLFPLPYKIGAGVLGGIAGYKIPALTKKYQGLDQEQIKNLNREYLKGTSNITDKYLKLQAPVTALYDLSKTSSLGSIAMGAGKAIRRLSGMAWGNKYIRRPVKIGAGAVGTLGAYQGYQRYAKPHMGPRSGDNYNTMLRNNILAGNINQEELSQEDAINVRQLGMR